MFRLLAVLAAMLFVGQFDATEAWPLRKHLRRSALGSEFIVNIVERRAIYHSSEWLLIADDDVSDLYALPEA